MNSFNYFFNLISNFLCILHIFIIIKKKTIQTKRPRRLRSTHKYLHMRVLHFGLDEQDS